MRQYALYAIIALIFLFLLSTAFSGFDDESFSVWSESIRKFSGMRNIMGKIRIETKLLDKNGNWYSNHFLFSFYSRDLRDYRIDFDEPEMLKGLTLLYQHREGLLYVINFEKEQYALQRFDGEEGMGFNPTEALINFLDFLLNIDSTPLLQIDPTVDENGLYTFRIQLSQPDILTLFQKEYPMINISLDPSNSINKITLVNEKTGEYLAFDILDSAINKREAYINEYFRVPLQDFTLIEYLGSGD